MDGAGSMFQQIYGGPSILNSSKALKTFICYKKHGKSAPEGMFSQGSAIDASNSILPKLNPSPNARYRNTAGRNGLQQSAAGFKRRISS